MVKKLLLLLLAVLTSATGVWAQAYINEPDKSWDFSTSESTEGLIIGNNDGASSVIKREALYDGKQGYHLNDGYIVVPVTKGQIVTFTLLGTTKYQTSYKVSIEDTNRAALSDPSYFDGVYGEPVERYFTAPENGWIKIEKGNNDNKWYAGVRAISVENAPTVAFSSTSCTAELINLGVDEPTLSYPSPSSVTYSVSNEKIAKLGGENAPGDIMCVNTGVTGVTATVNYKGNTYTASYTLTVKADDATYKVEGNTYTLTGPGKLQERVVNLVPKITMEFGSTEISNITIVRNENNAQIVGTTLDANGWRQLWFNSPDGLVHPYQGTFYTFKPKTAGKLTVTGYLNNAAQTAYIVNANNLAPVSERMTDRVAITNTSWHGGDCGVQFAPSVTTDDGRSAVMIEKYEEDVNPTGEILYQELTGLENGTYLVTLYANAMYTPDRGFDSEMADGATDVAYVFANDAQVPIKAQIATSTTENGEYTVTANVTNGTLRMGIGKWKAGTNWHTIQIKSLFLEKGTSDYSFTPVEVISTSSPNDLITTTVDVTGGDTYYLYGNIPSSNGVLDQWSTYQLKSFSFESDMRYASKSVVLAAGARAGGQDLITSSGTTSGITFSAKKEGDIDSFTLNPDNGHVSGITGNGGAIIVTASQIVDGNVIDSDYYVITVPYASHEWWFWNTENFPEKNEELDWATTYEVRSYDQTTRALYYLNEPILTAAEGLQGNNAMYIGKTAGLVVNAEAKTFGLRSSSDNLGDYATFRAFFLDNTANRTKYASYISDYDLDNLTEDRFSELKGDGSFVDVYLKAMLNYTKEDSHGTNIPAMNPGATITIPNVKAGSHIAIKWYRHAPNDGDHILLTNAVDLDDNEISNGIYVVNQGRGSNIFGNPYGWLEFKAATDGDVTLRSEKGWTHLKAIVLKEDGFYDTNLAIVNENSNSACKTLYTYPVGGSQSNTYSTRAYYTRSENGVQYVYTVEYDETTKGTANATISGGTLTATGQGQATLVLTCYSNGYAIDRETKLLTFLEITETHQDYPYTWDFTNISDDTKTKLGSDGNWTGNTSDGFKPSTTAQETFTQGNDLHFNDGSDVPELDELGFITSVEGTTSTGLSNVTVNTDGTGIVIGDQETTNIIVPDVPEGATVYVRVVTNENSEINGDEILTDGDDKVYSFEGSGSVSDGSAADITVSLKDITVEGIAVTNIFKEMRMASATNAGYYYNTDCQAKDIDYSLTKYYTGIEIKADYISRDDLSDATVNDDESGTLTAKAVEKAVPANTGLVVYTTNGKNNTLYPLFVPGINAEKESISNNMLTGVVFTSGASSTDHLYKYAPNAEAAGSTWYDFGAWEPATEISGTITGENGITLYGNGKPSIAATGESYEADNLTFTQCWKTGGKGEFKNGAPTNGISFVIEKAGEYKIIVYGKSQKSSAARKFMINVGGTQEADMFTALGASVTKGEYTATVADNTTIYLYSGDSGIMIYGISVEPAYDADQQPVDVVFYKGAIKKAEDTGYRRYFFTNKYTTTSEPGVSKVSDDPKFFQTNGGNLKSNRAYLDVPTYIFGGANVKSIRIIGLFDNTDDATAIELINEPAANEIDLNGEFYSISGVKVQGVPTQRGIYIQNGKKVMIK
ncbi:MAG: hypothetical protein IJ163_06035 [Bacteroidaceae bacterium]|nr:hypothetical protein [Bacteroidaceae bacterium]